jgi:uncharacterized membrane protein YcaP (DUF421 family)
MEWLFAVDWRGIFWPETPLLEIVVRGTVMYLGIFVLLRALLRREAGMVALPDILMIVLLADAAQNGMADDYRSMTDGILLVGVIVFWNLALDRLTYRFPLIARLVHPPPLPLVRDGRLIRANLRQESVSLDELWSRLRAYEVEELADVKAAYIEANGEITVITRDKRGGGGDSGRRPV